MVRPELRASIVLVLLTLLVFFRMLGYGFVELDDREYVTENPFVQAGLTPESIRWAFMDSHTGYAHPLTWLSHMLDIHVWGLNPRGHHLTSLILHIVNTLLLLLFFSRVTKDFWKSWFVAALFAVHPLHVESVAWVAERKDVLSGCFWALTLIAYAGYAEKRNPGRYLAVLLLFALGLMAKPMIVTLPFVLLLIDYWPLRRERRLVALVAEKIPLFALSAAACVITYLGAKDSGAVMSLEGISFFGRVSNAAVAYVTYLVKMVWPFGLAVYYPLQTSQPPWLVAACIAFLVIISAWVIYAWRRHRYLLVGWFWFLGTLVPVIGLLQVGAQGMADRYSYISLIGPFIMLAWGIPDLLSLCAPDVVGSSLKKSKALAAVAVAVVLGMAVLAFVQVGNWRDGVVLFKRAIAVGADNPLINYNLGLALTKQGRTEEAIECFDKTLQGEPGSAATHNRIAELQAGMGRMDEAVQHLGAAVQLQPDNASARNNLAITLAALGRKEQALVHFREAARLSPADIETRYNLAFALADQGLYEESAEQCRLMLQRDPNWSPAIELFAIVEERLRNSVGERPAVEDPR